MKSEYKPMKKSVRGQRNMVEALVSRLATCELHDFAYVKERLFEEKRTLAAMEAAEKKAR